MSRALPYEIRAPELNRLRTIDLIRALRQHTNLPLRAAKRAVELMVENGTDEFWCIAPNFEDLKEAVRNAGSVIYMRCHPGEILREEFLKPLHLSGRQLATELGVSVDEVVYLLAEESHLTPTLAEKLAKRLGTSVEFWTNLHTAWLESVMQDLSDVGQEIEKGDDE